MNYTEWLILKKEVNQSCDKAEESLKKFIGKFEAGIMGLTPDHVRELDEYKKLKKDFDFRFKDLQYFNSEKTYKKFQKEYHNKKRSNIKKQ